MSLENMNNTLSEQALPRRPHDLNEIRFFLQAFTKCREMLPKNRLQGDLRNEIITSIGEMIRITQLGNCIQLVGIPFWLCIIHAGLYIAFFMNGNA